jgi:hypothetical protein
MAVATNSPALALGMQVVRLRLPADDASDRYDDDREFSGPEIGDLSEVLDLPALQATG